MPGTARIASAWISSLSGTSKTSRRLRQAAESAICLGSDACMARPVEEDEGHRPNPSGAAASGWRNCIGMRRMASARKSSNASATSSRSRTRNVRRRRFVVCVRNAGYEASLERNKIYTVMPDIEAERDGDLRVIDESGEDYLFSADRFVTIEVPARVRASLLATAHD